MYGGKRRPLIRPTPLASDRVDFSSATRRTGPLVNGVVGEESKCAVFMTFSGLPYPRRCGRLVPRMLRRAPLRLDNLRHRFII